MEIITKTLETFNFNKYWATATLPIIMFWGDDKSIYNGNKPLYESEHC
jgi:hypothetical protein